MIRFLYPCIPLLFWVKASLGQNISNQRMFRDLVVTNYVTQAIGDTVYKFHVKMVEENDHHMGKRYHWFYQGNLRSTVGNHTGKLLHGPLEKFDRDGNLLEKGEFLQGLKEGDWWWWYPSGIVAQKCSWRHGWRSGAFEEYNANGSIHRMGRYKKDRLHGSLKVYNDTGGAAYVERYKRGTLMNSKIKKTLKFRKTEGEERKKRKEKSRTEKKKQERKGPAQDSSSSDVKDGNTKKGKNKKASGSRKKDDSNSSKP